MVFVGGGQCVELAQENMPIIEEHLGLSWCEEGQTATEWQAAFEKQRRQETSFAEYLQGGGVYLYAVGSICV